MISHSIFRTASPVLVVAWVFAAVAWLPHKAEASLIQDIFLTVPDTKLGEIAFPSESGSSALDLDFTFRAFPGVDIFFSEADITSVNWVLDPDTWTITSLFLEATTGDDPCPDDPNDCNFTQLLIISSEFSTLFTECMLEPSGYQCESFDPFGGVLDFRHAAPEPPTLWIFTLSLLTWTAAVRWNRRRRPIGASLSAV